MHIQASALSGRGEENRLDWRPLECFILAIPPFNFYSIGGNLPTASAIVDNVSIWKPSRSLMISNYRIMEAGQPGRVVNFLPRPQQTRKKADTAPDLSGLHFASSYRTMDSIWRDISEYIGRYSNWPRIVVESGGKDFIFMHTSADAFSVVNNIIRGGLVYQGQKCSAASRVCTPEGRWREVRSMLLEEIPKVRIGPVEDLESC